MISNILVTIASELSFLIGIIVGTFTSGLAALAITAMRGSGRLSVVRALLQGILTGLVAELPALEFLLCWDEACTCQTDGCSGLR